MASGLASCSFNFELTSQRTALENQIMGSYMEIDDDLIVTRIDNDGSSSDKSQQGERRDNIALQRAIRNRAFNADDISELKDSAILGEDADGRVILIPKDHPARQQATPEQLRLAEAIIDEENRDRSLIWSNELAKLENSKNTDLIAIKQNFARQIYESAPKGQWFYRDQKWQPKQ
jgi:hypothetical protein